MVECNESRFRHAVPVIERTHDFDATLHERAAPRSNFKMTTGTHPDLVAFVQAVMVGGSGDD